MKDERFDSDFPTAAQTMPKLFGECCDCGKVELKRKMTTICMRLPGEKPSYARPLKTVGFLCERCLPQMMDRYSIEEA